jgi:PAS domain S-box-containing protein
METMHLRTDPGPRESGLNLEKIFQAAPDAMLVLDGRGVILEANAEAERVFGYAFEEMRGRSGDMLIPEALRAESAPARERYLRAPERVSLGMGLELEGRRRDGSTFPVDVTVGPLETPAGKCLAVVVRDVTERRDAERESARRAQELTHVNAELEAFAYSVSHDLRTPLRAMQGLGIALEEDFAADLKPQARDYLDRIVAASKRMDRLILDLLAYSRVGRGQSVHQAVDLDPIWTAVRDDLGPGQREAVRLHAPLGRVWGNPSMLLQVATNLIANALKFVPEGTAPAVEVESRIAQERVRVQIKDNGIGIDPDHHVRIFGIFERLHGVEQYPGTGIGLALVKKAVEGMNGTIGVESRLGSGSCFWFELAQAEGA